jgi:hypothetical protein
MAREAHAIAWSRRRLCMGVRKVEEGNTLKLSGADLHADLVLGLMFGHAQANIICYTAREKQCYFLIAIFCLSKRWVTSKGWASSSHLPLDSHGKRNELDAHTCGC